MATVERAERARAAQAEQPVAQRWTGKAVTWRSVLIGVFLVPLNAYWVVQMEVIRYSTHPTTISLFFNVVFIL
ncbi:MAG: hypothetical protein NZ741_11905, partial [Armatimonadetes bacterium]|nr:hypothetical protein [Armatimonadota bacterium]